MNKDDDSKSADIINFKKYAEAMRQKFIEQSAKTPMLYEDFLPLLDLVASMHRMQETHNDYLDSLDAALKREKKKRKRAIKKLCRRDRG